MWLPNFRGNLYSKNHTTLSTLDPEFWDFSFYEMGTKDYPAIIDYVLAKTSNSKLYVIAHSQGTSATMTLLSERPNYNAKMRAVSLLAPVGYLDHSNLLFQLLGKVGPLLEVCTAKSSALNVIFKTVSLQNNILDIEKDGISSKERSNKHWNSLWRHHIRCL